MSLDRDAKRLVDATADAVIALDERAKRQARQAAELERQTEASRFARAAKTAIHRLSPKRDRAAEVTAFDERAAELEARQGALFTELTETRARIPVAAAEYEAALAAWHAAGQKGPRPENLGPELESRAQELQDDLEAVERLVEQELEAKADFVARHRKRLVRQAAQVTAEDRAEYESAIDELVRKRAKLLASRRDEIWCSLFPHEALQSEPPATALAGGLMARWRKAGIDRVFNLEQLVRLLHEDCDVLASSMTREQAAALVGKDARSLGPGAVWTATEEGRRREQAERKAAIARYEREWGPLPEYPGS